MTNAFFQTLVFYNNCNNGDIHYSRQFVKYFASKINAPCVISHFKCPTLLLDTNIPYVRMETNNIIQEPFVLGNRTLYMNTWIGQENLKWHCRNPEISSLYAGCTLKNNYRMFSEKANALGISLLKEHEYIPEIDFRYYKTHTLGKVNDKSVLICNGDVTSGQSKNFDMNQMTIELAKKYPSCIFYITRPFQHDLSNIIDVNLIFNNNGASNLNEISYLSTFCKIIVGRGSGPFCFAHIKQNLMDSNKTFIVSSNTEREGHWAIMSDYDVSEKAKQIWHECHVHKNDDCSLSLFEIIRDEIDEKFSNQ